MTSSCRHGKRSRLSHVLIIPHWYSFVKQYCRWQILLMALLLTILSFFLPTKLIVFGCFHNPFPRSSFNFGTTPAPSESEIHQLLQAQSKTMLGLFISWLFSAITFEHHDRRTPGGGFGRENRKTNSNDFDDFVEIIHTIQTFLVEVDFLR